MVDGRCTGTDFADTAVPFCGAARCALHNQVFLEGAKAALAAPLDHVSAGPKEGTVLAVNSRKLAVREWTKEAREVGLKAFGRVYAGWYSFSLLEHAVTIAKYRLGASPKPSIGTGFIPSRPFRSLI